MSQARLTFILSVVALGMKPRLIAKADMQRRLLPLLHSGLPGANLATVETVETALPDSQKFLRTDFWEM